MPISLGSLSKAAQSKGKESLHTSFVKAGGQPAVASQAGNTDEISLDDDDEEDEEEEEGAPATKKNIGGSLTLITRCRFPSGSQDASPSIESPSLLTVHLLTCIVFVPLFRWHSAAGRT